MFKANSCLFVRPVDNLETKLWQHAIENETHERQSEQSYYFSVIFFYDNYHSFLRYDCRFRFDKKWIWKSGLGVPLQTEVSSFQKLSKLCVAESFKIRKWIYLVHVRSFFSKSLPNTTVMVVEGVLGKWL